MPVNAENLHKATESGDPQLWPEIVTVYQENPGLRWGVLWHIRFYWKDHPDLVAPLVKGALRDRRLYDAALSAASRCPSLVGDVVASLRKRHLWESVPEKEVVATLACQLGYLTDPWEFEELPLPKRQRVQEKVRKELERRYGRLPAGVML
jgi:hypothetical protein